MHRRQTAHVDLSVQVLGLTTPSSYTLPVDAICTGGLDQPLRLRGLELRPGEPRAVTGLPVGAQCRVSASPDARFTTVYSPEVASEPAASKASSERVDDPGTDAVASEDRRGQATVAPGGSSIGVVQATRDILVVKLAEAPAGHPIDLDAEFTFDVDCGDAYSGRHRIRTNRALSANAATGVLRWADLPPIAPGTGCSVAEVERPDGWTPTDIGIADVVAPALDDAEDGDSADVTAAFVSRRDTAALTVTAELVGVPDSIDLDGEQFEVDVVCRGSFAGGGHRIEDRQLSAGAALIIDRLPTGAVCTVDPADDARFEISDSGPAEIIRADVGGAGSVAGGGVAGGSVAGGGVAGGSVAGGAVGDGVGGAAVRIGYTTSSLSITQTAIGPGTHGLRLDDTFRFALRCVAPSTDASRRPSEAGVANGSRVSAPIEPVLATEVEVVVQNGLGRWADEHAPLLAPGSNCWVAARPDPRWLADGDQFREVTTEAGVTTDVEFRAVRRTATLTVTTSLAGVPFGVDLDGRPFTVTSNCIGDFDNVDGVIAITGSVSADAPMVTADLPIGARCRVEQAVDPGFVTSYSSGIEPILIAATGGRVELTNTTSVLVAAGAGAPPTDRPVEHTLDFETRLRFEVVCDDGTSGTHVITTDLDTPTGRVGLLPWHRVGVFEPGTVCTASAMDTPAGWRLASTPSVTTGFASLPEVARFDSVRTVGSLAVRVALRGLPDEVDPEAEAFPVTVRCTGDFADGDHRFRGEVSVGVDWILEGLPSGATCDVSTIDDARFTPRFVPSGGAAEIDDGESRVTLVNSTGVLSIAKIVTGAGADGPVDADNERLNRSFLFEIDCDNGFEGMVPATVDDAADAGGVALLGHPELPLLATGTTCTIEEVAVPGWESLGEDGPVTALVSADRTDHLVFHSRRVEEAGPTTGSD